MDPNCHNAGTDRKSDCVISIIPMYKAVMVLSLQERWDNKCIQWGLHTLPEGIWNHDADVTC